MNRRLKYKLKCLITPMCWTRNYRTDPEWDAWLWDALEHDRITLVCQHYAMVDGILVWLENYPYASGTTTHHDPRPRRACSRATALFLRDKLPAARLIMALTGPHPPEFAWVNMQRSG